MKGAVRGLGKVKPLREVGDIDLGIQMGTEFRVGGEPKDTCDCLLDYFL